jgi:hypothetical protein
MTDCYEPDTFLCAFLGCFAYENERVKEIEPPYLERRAIRVSGRSTQPSMSMAIPCHRDATKKKL